MKFSYSFYLFTKLFSEIIALDTEYDTLYFIETYWYKRFHEYDKQGLYSDLSEYGAIYRFLTDQKETIINTKNFINYAY